MDASITGMIYLVIYRSHVVWKWNHSGKIPRFALCASAIVYNACSQVHSELVFLVTDSLSVRIPVVYPLLLRVLREMRQVVTGT